MQNTNVVLLINCYNSKGDMLCVPLTGANPLLKNVRGVEIRCISGSGGACSVQACTIVSAVMSDDLVGPCQVYIYKHIIICWQCCMLPACC